MKQKQTLLVIDDDPAILKTLRIALELNGFEAKLAANLKEAEDLIQKIEADLILLDLDLPDGHGFELLETLRQTDNPPPIIILKANLDESSALKGLELGAHDYVRKPFGVKELVARIWRSLSRPVIVNHGAVFAGLELNSNQRQLQYQKKTLSLTKRQCELLELFMKRPGQIVSREQILDHFKDQGELLDRSIDAHICHLRKKLASLSVPGLSLKTIYGSGFKLECD